MSLTANEYQDFCISLTKHDLSEKDLWIRNGLKTVTEASEVCDLFEKHFYQGHPLARDKVIMEMGDLWYYQVHSMYLAEATFHDFLGRLQWEKWYFKHDSISKTWLRLMDYSIDLYDYIRRRTKDGIKIDHWDVQAPIAKIFLASYNILSYLGSSDAEVMQVNYDKLKARYPSGRFDVNDSITRRDQQSDGGRGGSITTDETLSRLETRFASPRVDAEQAGRFVDHLSRVVGSFNSITGTVEEVNHSVERQIANSPPGCCQDSGDCDCHVDKED